MRKNLKRTDTVYRVMSYEKLLAGFMAVLLVSGFAVAQQPGDVPDEAPDNDSVVDSVPGDAVVDTVRNSLSVLPFVGGNETQVDTPVENPEEDEDRGISGVVSDTAQGVVDGVRDAVPG